MSISFLNNVSHRRPILQNVFQLLVGIRACVGTEFVAYRFADVEGSPTFSKAAARFRKLTAFALIYVDPECIGAHGPDRCMSVLDSSGHKCETRSYLPFTITHIRSI